MGDSGSPRQYETFGWLGIFAACSGRKGEYPGFTRNLSSHLVPQNLASENRRKIHKIINSGKRSTDRFDVPVQRQPSYPDKAANQRKSGQNKAKQTTLGWERSGVQLKGGSHGYGGFNNTSHSGGGCGPFKHFIRLRVESQMETGAPVPAAVELKNNVDSKVPEEETRFADIDKVGENNIMKPENATKLTKLFVRNLPNNLNGASLAAKFQDFGIPVTDARIYGNRGIGFVVVKLADHDRALGLNNEIRILGRSIGIEVFNARNARENQGSQTKHEGEAFFTVNLTLIEWQGVQLFRILQSQCLV
ncbi:hypothetical protein B0H11DRAFT_1902420 [Mycena galericulata]|nr:hypothetical protein B0H11DRAFT_1902420 [Mycena galericulata]